VLRGNAKGFTSFISISIDLGTKYKETLWRSKNKETLYLQLRHYRAPIPWFLFALGLMF
jgi:hypothetical protein